MNTDRAEPALFPFPSAWYCIDDARDVAAGEVRRARLCGEEIVYYRTRSGELRVSEAYCPHMGAHFGRGGKVVGEHLQCPFHGFEYGGDGRCARVPGGGGVPKLRARVLPHAVHMDHIFVWYDYLRRPPSFELAPFARPLAPARSHAVTLAVHPQEVAENGADWRHFHHLHHNDFHISRSEVDPERPSVFRTFYEGRIFEESQGGQWLRDRMRATVDVAMQGLGFLSARCDMHVIGIVNQYLLCPTPIDEQRTKIHIIVAFEEVDDPTKLLPPLRWLPADLAGAVARRAKRPLARLLTRALFRDTLRVQLEDAEVWDHKIHRATRRGLDRSVVAFREYAEQFYPGSDPYISLDAAQRLAAGSETPRATRAGA